MPTRNFQLLLQITSADHRPSDMDVESSSQNSTEETLDDQTSIHSIEASSTKLTIIKDSVEIFEEQLKNNWARKKIPKGMKKKFQQTRVAQKTATSRIFFDNGGFKAWFTYFLATEGKAHFKGRRNRSDTIAAFQQLPLADQANVARKVASKRPHPSVSNAIRNISENFQDAGMSQILLLLPFFIIRRLGVLEARLNEVRQHSSPAESLIGAIVSSRNVMSGIAERSLESGTSQHLVLEEASLLGIAEVFDQYMCSAIRKDAIQSEGSNCFKAAVTMNFPFHGLVDCLMSLAIYETKVQYLAMSLFNVHVESAGQVRYVVLNEGAKLLPSPEMTLKGALDEAIVRTLGPEIHGAIQASRMRRKELEEGNNVTECVSMMLTSRPNEGAIINLSLGLKGGAQIQKKLYT